MKREILNNTFEYLIRDYQRKVKCTGKEKRFVVSFDTIPRTKCKKQPSANKGLQSNGIHSMSIVNANVLINILPE